MFNHSVVEKLKAEMKQRKFVLSLKGLSCETAVKTAILAQKAGFGTFEVSLKTPFSGKTVEMLTNALDKTAIVGAGEVFANEYSAGDVEYACQYGARFVNSPVSNTKLTDAARNSDCVCICGAETASELYFAHRQGNGFVRLPFLSGVGTQRICEIREMISHINLCICGNVPPKTLGGYFKSGLALYVLEDLRIAQLASEGKWDLLEKYLTEKRAELSAAVN